MSSGGMDWAYRMLAAHDLDPLGALVVMHLGWRDAASQRTDRGIAAALGQHRSSIRLATAKLERLGIICRRSRQWVAVETVRIVEQAPDALVPDAASSDGPVSGPGQSVARGGPVSGPQKGQSVAPMRKEKIKKGAAVQSAKPVHRQPRRLPPVGGGAAGASIGEAVGRLSDFQRKRLREGSTVQVDGVTVTQGSAAMGAWQAALRAVESGGLHGQPQGSTVALARAVAIAGEGMAHGSAVG